MTQNEKDVIMLIKDISKITNEQLDRGLVNSLQALLTKSPKEAFSDMLKKAETKEEALVLGVIIYKSLIEVLKDEIKYPTTDKLEVKTICDSNDITESLVFNPRFKELSQRVNTLYKECEKGTELAEKISKECIHANELFIVGFLFGLRKLGVVL